MVYGAIVSLRLLSVLSAGALVVFTTYPSDLILALTKLRVPHSFAFMLTLALRFLPETVEQGKRILVAQQLRGGGGKGLVCLPFAGSGFSWSHCWSCRSAVPVR